MTDGSRPTAGVVCTMTKRSALLSAALLLLVLACRQPTAPLAACEPMSSGSQGSSPPWPATATGCWVQIGVDTYAEFHLVQQGTAVSGTFNLCGALTGCTTHYPVSGTAAYPHVVLHWTEVNVQQYHETFDATVTAAADSLVGSVAANGQSPGPTAFVRTAAR